MSGELENLEQKSHHRGLFGGYTMHGVQFQKESGRSAWHITAWPEDGEVREYLAEAARTLLSESRFLDAVPGFVPDYGRVPLILDRLKQLSR